MMMCVRILGRAARGVGRPVKIMNRLINDHRSAALAVAACAGLLLAWGVGGPYRVPSTQCRAQVPQHPVARTQYRVLSTEYSVPSAQTQTSSEPSFAASSHTSSLRQSPCQPQSLVVDWTSTRLCQALGPAAPNPIWGVDSTAGCGLGEVTWQARGEVDWQAYAQGEYVGHARSAHVGEYRIRVDDQIAFVFRLTREVTGTPYELQVGDQIRVESLTGDAGAGDNAQDNIRRDLIVQPDGTISLPLLGQVRAEGMTIDALRQLLEERYTRYYKVPAITVTPLAVNTKLQDLIAAVDARQGTGGLKLEIKVNPDGKLYLPGLGAVCAQGMTVEELKLEVDARYAATIPGVEVTPVITQRDFTVRLRAGRGEDAGAIHARGPDDAHGRHRDGRRVEPGRQPAASSGLPPRRRLAALGHDARRAGALYARRPAPADEIWLNDSDIVVVPKNPILVVDEFISQFFTQGLYRAFPQFSIGQFDFENFRSISN